MDPNNRRLLRVNLTDAAIAEKRIHLLMGDQVEPRKEWSLISKLAPRPAPIAYSICFNSAFDSMSWLEAFSQFNTFPLNGKMAWVSRFLYVLAEPPALSPSTKNNSFFE